MLDALSNLQFYLSLYFSKAGGENGYLGKNCSKLFPPWVSYKLVISLNNYENSSTPEFKYNKQDMQKDM